MAIVLNKQPPTTASDRIYTSREEADEELNLKQLQAQIEKLARKGRLTSRDEQLLELLREMNVLSLDQVRRLLWPQAKEKTAYTRLNFLLKQQLLVSARSPRSGMLAWDLPPRKVYALGPAGKLWLKEEVNNGAVPRYLKRDQVLHDLLVSEFFVRLTEAVLRRGEAWSMTWAGERSAGYYEKPGVPGAPTIAPDGFGMVQQYRGKEEQAARLPFFVEMDVSREAHGKLSSDWGRKVVGYDRFITGKWKEHPELGGQESFPLVAVITHGHQRLLNLAAAIRKHRRQPVIYYLAVWNHLIDSKDALLAPAWIILTPDGQLLGEKPDERQSLLPVSR